MITSVDSAIEIKNASVEIERHKIVRNISVNVPSGKIIGLLGPSGAGKTTLIRSIVGRQRVTHGEINIFSLPAGSPALRTQIGYMPQAISVYNDLTVEENLHYLATMIGYGKRQAMEVIQEVDMTEYANRLVKGLSGGQKNRVSLAAALLGQPRLLVLDEPTVGVDPLLRIRLWQLFRKMADQGTTILVTSHVMEEANHCDELLLIRRGKLLAAGTPKSLKEQTGTHDIENSFIALVEARV